MKFDIAKKIEYRFFRFKEKIVAPKKAEREGRFFGFPLKLKIVIENKIDATYFLTVNKHIP